MIDSIEANKVNYDALDTIHLACYGRHFVSLLSAPVVPANMTTANVHKTTNSTAGLIFLLNKLD